MGEEARVGEAGQKQRGAAGGSQEQRELQEEAQVQSGEGRGDGLLEFYHRELCGMLDSTDQRFQTEEEKLTQRHKMCTR